MFTAAGLLDLHERTGRSFAALLRHCEGFTTEELGREIDGFGYPFVLAQLHHAVGAERYWIGVLEGKMLTDEDPADRASLEAVRAYRERVVATTAAYLESASETELNQPRKMTTWGGKEHELVPARVVLRTQTHVFQHQGQVTAMCRLLGRPVPAGLDFPLG